MIGKFLFVVVMVIIALITNFLIPPKEFPNRLAVISTTDINNDFYDIIEYATTWSDSKSWAQGLHLLNPTRLNYILKFFENNKNDLQKTAQILDIGCGGGLLANELAKANFTNLHGIDLSENSVVAAKKESLQQNLNIDYKQGNIYKIPYGDEKFDFVILADILDHLSDLKSAMKEVNRILKPKGFIFFETIDRNFMSHLFIKLLGETFNIIPKNTHDYRLFVTPNELKTLFKEFKFNVLEIKGVDFSIGFNENYRPMVYNSTLIDNVKHLFLGYARKE